MRLEELKIALVEQFFKASDNGIHVDQLFDVFVSLGKHLKIDLTSLIDKDVDMREDGEDKMKSRGISADPSKAFKRFTTGKNAVLAILEEPGIGTGAMVIFAAARTGKTVYLVDLTAKDRNEKKSDFATVKQALRQAKNLNDDAYFSIASEE